MTTNRHRFIHFFFFVRGLGLGLIAQAACNDGTGPVRTAATCAAYCDRADECDPDVDEGDCRDTCKETIDDCMADEQESTLDDLDACAEEACGEFAACTVGAGLQCTFGA